MTVNSGDKNNWREKYLNALDEQEQLEKQFASQQELLRSALVRLSIAADGQDETLDQIMAKLREQLRSKMSATEFNSILAQLETAALAFEQNREQGAQDIRQAIMDAAKPLQHFKLSRGVKKELSDYLAQLPQRSKKVRLYPALLQQLAKIQQQALGEIEQPKTGLFDKILGSKTNPKIADAGDEQDEYAIADLPPMIDSPSASVEPIVSHLTEEYSAQIIRVLNQFFTSLENETAIKNKVEVMRRKLEQGVSVDSLVPLLDSVRDLVMEAYLAANQAFATYLKNVNQELAEIYMLLGGAVKNTQDERAASRKLQDDVMREMNDLEVTATSATDINQLKDTVKSQLGNIRQVIDHYQQTDQAQQFLAEQLQTLGAKIKTMEVEAEKNRTTLEAHRQKALHDPLTELPNREAYNERASAEVQRWQRYGRPLTIAIFDIDHFKRINDTYGHQAGDRVIKVIGRSIAKRLREVDFFCRYGGEEFVALMPETDSATALTVLEKVRDAIANAAFNYKEQPMSITLSVGLTEFKTNDSLESAFERADQALYTAKSNGRNRCQLS
ncbi:GGDEF domain-containing protein [Cellvibrio fibrivorans]|uniref:diguanylate cyclase n=1 Tax=Cellvibrio fibrivorans TaxID=126350 RepID=A0ABU1UU65_9GAMM|nr:GGDEF domain-containing protein [Cellvibrio fibrivorans]MDR7088729.1 diguanylate cyclase [Cellvibrio fibrivorans]